MRRRRPLIAAGAALLAVPCIALSQLLDRVWRIGILSNGSGPSENLDAFREGLRALGYVEGRNVLIEYRWGAGKDERLPELALELVRLSVDVIVTVATAPAAAAKQTTSVVPVVMVNPADPVGTGLIASLARPGGNLTGMSQQSTDVAGKRVQLLRDLLPQLSRIGALVLKGGPAAIPFLEQVATAGQRLGITMVAWHENQPEVRPSAFVAMQRERVQALIVQLSPFTFEYRKQIAEFAAQQRLPTLFEARSFVDLGGLMSYGPNPFEMYRRAAYFVDRIFKGAKPADLPVEQPAKFEMVINARTAKALGITIPQSLLLRADEVIQ